MSMIAIHPLTDTQRNVTGAAFSGGTLICACVKSPVKVSIKHDLAHNHACGCTQCWKPTGANFSIVAVVPTKDVEVL
jgi:S-(hydroxymethyl)glutathione synthase